MSLAKRFRAEPRQLPTLLGHAVVATLEQALLRAPQEVAALVLRAADLQRCLRRAWLALRHPSHQIADSDTIAVQVALAASDRTAWRVVNANIPWGVVPVPLALSLQRLMHADDGRQWLTNHPWWAVGADGICEAEINLAFDADQRAVEGLGVLYRVALEDRENEAWVASGGSDVASDEVSLQEGAEAAVADAIERLAREVCSGVLHLPAMWPSAAVHARLPRMRLVLLNWQSSFEEALNTAR